MSAALLFARLVCGAGLNLECWHPPAELSLLDPRRRVLELHGNNTVYPDYHKWRVDRRPHPEHCNGPHPAAKWNEASLPMACEQRPALQISLLVMSFKSPKTLRHTIRLNRAVGFMTASVTPEAIFYLNARTGRDDEAVGAAMLGSEISVRLMGHESNIALGAALSLMAAEASHERVMFLEKDWYIPAARRHLVLPALRAGLSMVAELGVDMVHFTGVSFRSNTPVWPCGVPSLPMLCTVSRFIEYSNRPYLAKRSWVR